MAQFLNDGQVVVLNPGRTGGALEFYRIVKKNNPDANFVPAETQTLIYACRLTGPAEATIYKVKNSVSVAALPASRTDEVLEALNRYYPQFCKAENILETSLLNIGAIFHPAPAVLNIARIEGKEEFEYYMSGITPCVSNLLERIDLERMAIAEVMDVPTISVKQWLGNVYDAEISADDSIYDAVQKQSGYRGISAPKDPYARYITEDVPMSLVPLSELGRAFGVETPAMDSVIAIAGFLHNTDYRSKGRTLESLGLKGVSLEKLTDFVNSGTDL
jgi:opine dehydrogenase